ncbi:MAG: DUF1800 domain-containing protein [Gammaproteobacteria bacterium]|nr:DUF1800 domain-containing protein [Gammaproteobacteria bacterium]MDD9895682.1 DUF1800 domain-containing protein [Gammaproteobacteria bacterium]MDD9957998.1 DUF1800 domain-containing protein [Gammaproteobacteria bacterium]
MRGPRTRALQGLSAAVLLLVSTVFTQQAFAQDGIDSWQDDLAPIANIDWNYDRAAHLLERAGFGGTPDDIERLAAMSPREAVRSLVYFDPAANSHLRPFDHSGIHDPGLEPFPPSRPATTDLARETGEALGVKVKPTGNRRLQPVVNKFFYWLRASVLETNRVAYWWANRMVASNNPLQEKMALFWHGHYAVNESKVRDYRKLLMELELFHEMGTGNFRDLMVAVAQDPAMLSFLDAGVNVKGAPNENFAREIMELFTMGVGNYSETDIREAARAFTGWNYVDLEFVINEEQHDDGVKKFLGRSGDFDGIEVIDIIMEQPVTAEYIAGKMYRFFARDELSAELQADLGNVFRDNDYEVTALLETIFLSKDFYSAATVGTHIKSPVELAVSTYIKLGLDDAPGVPDFNSATGALGQTLFRPPTVAGWAGGRSWITPGLLLERGNFARDVLFPDINFIPSDRRNGSREIQSVAQRIREGMDITSATQPSSIGEGQVMAESNMLADRDEDFNTRYGSFRGWQMAIERVKPISRHTARLNLSKMVLDQQLTSTSEVVDYFIARFMRVAPGADARNMLIDFLSNEIGTTNIVEAESYMEDSLRMTLHLLFSQPEYQLS